MPGMGTPSGSGGSTVVSAFHSALLSQGALILLVAVLLLVVWNALRSLQYRRAVARGDSYPPPRRPLGVEPYARRVLRLGFGFLWIIDGLLQLQPGMPLGMPTDVLQPSAASAPGWVQGLVGFGVTTWSRHPSEAAASAVWIQLGIGVFLLVAPRGRWSQAAAVMSMGWGLVVWVFGEAFGGIFSPGLTFLFGAPGGVLLYVVGGGLLALPERLWSHRHLGRTILGSLGVLLLVMAGLQAWPGRGFWQGMTSGRPGTLAGMVQQMAGTPQPHPLSSLVSSFASFDQAHGLAVNLFAVVVMAAIGLALVWGGRFAFPALVALVVFAAADWLLIEDMGIWGGTGTDPNSMIPLVLLAVSGYLAVVRAPATEDAAVTEVSPVAAIAAPAPAGTGPDGEPLAPRPWWDRLDPGHAGRILAAVGAVAIVLVGTAPMVAASVNPHADTLLAQSVNGPPTVIDGPAPAFHLIDQAGQAVALSDLRGYTVALTFLDPVCTTDCPAIAQEFRVANQMLGASASDVRFVAVVANPTYNSVASVDAFDRQEQLQDQSNWLFLTGSRGTLENVWSDYGVNASIEPAGGMASHADLTYVIDAHGNTRRAIDSDPGDGEADESSFSTLLTEQITQVMHS